MLLNERSRLRRFLAGICFLAWAMCWTLPASAQEAVRPELRIYHLQFIEAQAAARMITQVLKADAELRVGLDERTNSVVVSALPELQQQVDALLTELDQVGARNTKSSTELPPVQIRVFWLVSSDGGNPLPERLQPVVAELESLGITDLTLGGQMAVNVGKPGRPFSVSGRQNLNGNPYKLQFEGVLTAGERGVPNLEARVAYGSARDENDAQIGNIDTTIEAPLNQFVVLGSTDIGLSNSVFVLQVVPRSEAASKK